MAKNSSCLEGIKCPECGQEDRFRITISVMAEYRAGTLTDEGSIGDLDDDNSYICCNACGYDGDVGEFKKPAVPVVLP